MGERGEPLVVSCPEVAKQLRGLGCSQRLLAVVTGLIASLLVAHLILLIITLAAPK